jgi:oxygen-independent coproporphyrinogen-3 oxidase
MTGLRAPPLSLYVHLPWCVRKCPYCDFNSHRAPAAVPFGAYVDALLDDFEFAVKMVPGRAIASIFLGGGTPSLFPPADVERLLSGLRTRARLGTEIEITMEANPGTIEHGRFREYAAAGITRISLGAQSFDAGALRTLGRIHGPAEIINAVDELRAAGIANFNIDLMYGLPAQTLDRAIADVERAIELEPAHLSHYQLTVEPETAFHRRPPALPDADDIYAMQLECQRVLAENGYGQYEISAYARAGAQCRHNLNYWQYGDYLGIGAGAHGKQTDCDAGRIDRTVRCRQPRTYLDARDQLARVASVAEVPIVERPFEFLLNALRLRSGFTRELFEARTGVHLTEIEPVMAVAQARGLLETVDSEVWAATELGLRFLNDLQAMFLPETTVPR